MMEKFYLELQVQLSLEQEDLWSAFCFEKGALGIEVLKETETAVEVRVFFEEQDIETVRNFPEQFCQCFQQPLQAIHLQQLNLRPYEDWQSHWMQHFLPLDAGQSFTICPPWQIDEISAGKTLIIIEPGQGFGTGSHPSTILALETMEQIILQSSQKITAMADIGTGSGILAVAAAHLGVPLIHGVDQDIAAIRNVLKNRKLNALENTIYTIVGRPNCLNKQYPLVVSNMLLHELIQVSEDLARLVQPSGNLICSGFLANQWLQLEKTFQNLGMFSRDQFQKEGWRAAIFTHGFP